MLDDNSAPCNLLPSNSSLELAANWENIPETALINGVIGLILFFSFQVMTYIAWHRNNSEELYNSPDLITFLYGYRDPDKWYVIPRFEFIRDKKRHHIHDLNYPYLYVPSRLPLANPIDIFAYKTYESTSKSADDKPKRLEKNIQPLALQCTSKETDVRGQNASNNVELKESDTTTTSKKSTKSTLETIHPKQVQDGSNAEKALIGTKPVSALSQSFFYPTILTAEQTQASPLSRRLNRFFSMFFRVTDADIIYAKGNDAYEYLLFQRHLILIMIITNVFCLGLILPTHWYSDLASDNTLVLTTSFQRTTIKNMRFTSIYYWIHIVSCICIVIFSVYILKSYRESILTESETQLSRRTLLIGNIPVEQRTRVNLVRVIREHLSIDHIEAIQFVYDTTELFKYQSKLSTISMAKEYCLQYRRKYNRELMIKPTDVNEGQYCKGNCRLCSFFYVCCCYWPQEKSQPGVEFYSKQEQVCRSMINSTCEKMVKEPSEYAFVTFNSYKQARKVLRELARIKAEALGDSESRKISKSLSSRRYRRSLDINGGKNLEGESNNVESTGSQQSDPLDPKNNPHVRSIRSPIKNNDKNVSKKVATGLKRTLNKLEGPLSWSVRYAPHPDNVEYGDLLNIATTKKYTIILLHAIMIVIFIFFTTPNVVLSILERMSVLRPDKAKQLTGFQAIIINYLSILLQVITTALLPYLITFISRQIPYENTASKEHSIMWKVYLFLVLMVIIMPSVGMSSAQALFIPTDINPKCLFPTDNGAYYINYVISSLFLSLMLELIKPSDIVSYFFLRWTSRSIADYEDGRQYINSEFSVGMQHTGVLLIFSVVMTYAISCPLIAPVGLVYLVVKHAIDHYHLFYSYFTRKVDRNLQSTIMIFVKVALLLMLFQTTVAISINTGTSYFSLISQIIFWITLVTFIINCFFYCTSRLVQNKRQRYRKEFCACFYLPRVIEDLLRMNAVPTSCISKKC